MGKIPSCLIKVSSKEAQQQPVSTSSLALIKFEYADKESYSQI